MKKLDLKKKVVSVLTSQEQQQVVGGAVGTTSFTGCSGFLCCDVQACKPASLGDGESCLLHITCRDTDPKPTSPVTTLN